MRITYTADDGTNWESEAECLGWERFSAVLAEKLDDQESDSYDDELYGFVSVLREFDEREFIWKERKNFYRLAVLISEVEKGDPT